MEHVLVNRLVHKGVFLPRIRSGWGMDGIRDKGSWDFIRIVSVQSVVNRFGVDQGFFTTDSE